MASQRSSSATLKSDRDDSVFTYSPPSWAHKEWEQYYNYPSLSQPPAPGHGMGESHFTTLPSPSLGLKPSHAAPENTSREPHTENIHSRDSDTHQSHTSTARSPAGHPWQRSAREETTTPPSLASINSLIGNSGQAPHTPSILSSLGNEGPGYSKFTSGLSSPIGASFLFPQQVSLPGGSPLKYSSQQSPGSTKRSSSSPFSEEESYGSSRCSPTVRFHVDSATMFGDFESPHRGGKAAALPPRPPTKRARREVLSEPRTPSFTQHPSGDSFRSNISESPPSSYSSISPNYPGFTPDISPSPPLGGTRGKLTFSTSGSLSPSTSQLSPELFSPTVTTFPKDFARKTISERKRFIRESLPEMLSASSPQLSPEPFSPPGPAFPRYDTARKEIRRLTPVKEESFTDSLSSRSSQGSPESPSPLGPAFSRGGITRQPPKAEDMLGDAEFWQYIKPDDVTCSADTRDYISPSHSQRQFDFSMTDSLSPSTSQLSPELFSSPVTTFPKDFARKSISERKRFIRESIPDLLPPRSSQLPPESFNPPGPAFPRYDTARKAIRPLTPLSPEQFPPPVTTFPEDFTRRSISERKRFIRESIPDLLPPSSSQLPPESFSPPGPAFPRYDTARKAIRRLTPIKDESFTDSLSCRSSQGSPESPSPLGPSFSRGDISQKTIRQQKSPTWSADTRDYISPSLSQRQFDFSTTDSLSPSTSQLSPELFSTPVTTFPKDFARKSISERKRFIREHIPDLLPPSSSQLPPESFNPPGPAIPRYNAARKPTRPLTYISPDLLSPPPTTFPEDLAQKSISERKRFIRESIPDLLPPTRVTAFSKDIPPQTTPLKEMTSTDWLSPSAPQLSPEPFSPRVTAFPRAITRKTKQQAPPKAGEMLGDAEFWQHISSDDSTCSADTSADFPPTLPPRKGQTQSSGWSLNANVPFSQPGMAGQRQRQTQSSGYSLNVKVPFSRPRTAGQKQEQPQASLRSFGDDVPFSNPGKMLRQHPVNNLTVKTYQNFIQQQKTAVIMFYSTGKAGAETPETWDKESLTRSADFKPRFGAVDCAKEKGLCSSENVPSYPFYKMYSRGYLINAVKDFALLKSPIDS